MSSGPIPSSSAARQRRRAAPSSRPRRARAAIRVSAAELPPSVPCLGRDAAQRRAGLPAIRLPAIGLPTIRPLAIWPLAIRLPAIRLQAIRPLAIWLLASGLALGGLAPLAAQARLAELAAQAERLGHRTGVAVVDLRTGATLFEHRASEAFIPASNQKLLTVAAALWGLGDDFRFTTRFAVRDGILLVRPGGDPNWSSDAHPAQRIFEQLAAALRSRGIEKLRGVRLAPGRFTGPSRPAGWPRDQFDRHYCAPTGGLVLEAGLFRARIAAGRREAEISLLEPPAAVTFGGAIKMSSERKPRYSYWISQRDGQFFGHGEFSRRADPVEVEGVCQEPDWLFAQTLVSVLRGAGLEVAATQPDADADPAAGPDALAKPAREASEVFRYATPLREALAPILKDSSNFHAEQVLRVLGAETRGDGSFDGGCAAVRRELAKHLELPADLQIADGSGLSRGNRVSPAFLVRLLRELCSGPHGRLVLQSLARGGVDGTLRKRFRQTPQLGQVVHAKTGTINGVKALSGMVQLPSGRLRLFSIIMNRRKGTSMRGVSRLQEQMVHAMYTQD